MTSALSLDPPLRLRGPRHLMRCLRQLDIDPDTDGSHYVVLDEDHVVEGVEIAGENCRGHRNVIAVIIDNHSPAQLPPLGDVIASIPEDVHLLDVLTITSHRWRSLMCDDLTCCPENGLALDSESLPTSRRHALHAQWQAWLTIGSIPRDFQVTAVHSLEDLPLRDSLLSGLVHSPETMKQWRAVVDDLNCPLTPPIYSILASISFIEGNRENAQEFLDQALQSNREYSLAKLLRQALESDAPVSIVMSAFAKYTPEELLQRATHDISSDVEISQEMTSP